MKTIVLFNSFDCGSTGTLCSSLKKYLKKLNVNVLFVCGNQKNSGNADFYIFDKIPKVFRYSLIKKNQLFGKIDVDLAAIFTRKVINYLEKNINFKNDEVIFHFHNMQYSYMSIKSLIRFANKKHVKTILTMHDCWPISGGCDYFTLSNCNQWRTDGVLCKSCPLKLKNTRKEILKKQALFKNTQIIAPSKWLDDLVSCSILKSCNHTVINNGIDTSFWNYSTEDKKSKTINLISVASPWNERKGLQYLNELANILPENYRLTIVGLENDQKVNDKILRYGKLDKEKLRDLYSKSHIFINPTLEDNFPTVNIEAQLCGLFVCSFDTGGSKEIFSKETGSPTLDKSAKSILDSIVSVNISDQLFSKCRKRGLFFSLDRYCEQHLEIYGIRKV